MFPLLIKLIRLHTVVVLHYIHHINMACLITAGLEGENCQNAQKHIIIKAYQVTSFVQTCSFISIYNDMYTQDSPQWTEASSTMRAFAGACCSGTCLYSLKVNNMWSLGISESARIVELASGWTCWTIYM